MSVLESNQILIDTIDSQDSPHTEKMEIFKVVLGICTQGL